ncbi:MAG: flagellar basal body P-ring formation protein FlgA [Candidatus Lambdaproteobacteria bacterium]|nr:flagellar basal body P-ring formation protein FlgA [Candidatus Lambdaproteobacteria bacterium]
MRPDAVKFLPKAAPWLGGSLWVVPLWAASLWAVSLWAVALWAGPAWSAPAPALAAAAAAPVPVPEEEAGAEPAALNAIEVRVLARAEVGGDTYRLGEIAEMDGFDVQELTRLAQVEIGRSPLPGRALPLSEALLRSRLAQGGEPGRLRISVPEGAEVVRSGRVIKGEEIAELVLARALADAELPDSSARQELKQELVGAVQDVVVPRGELEWDIQLLGRHLVPGGYRNYAVVLKVDGQEAWRTIVRVQQKVYQEIVVAKNVIRRNQTIAADDVMLLRQNLALLKGRPYVTALAKVVGKTALRPIARNEMLAADLLTNPADIGEGGGVTLVFTSPGLVLKAPGVALVAARVGQFIPVRNLQSGKIVYGTLRDDETVRVQ